MLVAPPFAVAECCVLLLAAVCPVFVLLHPAIRWCGVLLAAGACGRFGTVLGASWAVILGPLGNRLGASRRFFPA